MLTLHDHPARERNITTGELQPAFPQLRQICWQGKRVAYCSTEPGQPVTFVRRYPESFRQSVVDFLQKEIGTVGSVHQPPLIRQQAASDAQ